jgi:glycerophosphoryl diester phosphodiesterase
LFAESSVYSFMSIVTSVHLLLQQLVAKHVNQVIIDAKVGPPHFEEGMAAAIFSLIRETGCNNCIMWAKADKIVQEFMYLSQDPESVGYIVMNDTVSGKVTELLRMEGAHVVGAYHGLVTKKLVTTAHRAGKRVHAWTVDDESVMQRTLKAGVDAIITSLPGVLQRVMSSERQRCMVNGFS